MTGCLSTRTGQTIQNLTAEVDVSHPQDSNVTAGVRPGNGPDKINSL